MAALILHIASYLYLSISILYIFYTVVHEDSLQHRQPLYNTFVSVFYRKSFLLSSISTERFTMSIPEYLSALSDLPAFQHSLGLAIATTADIPSTPLNCRIIIADVENNERDQGQLLDWGQHVLDTWKVHGLQPGDDGAEYLRRGEARHYRVKEHAHIINKRLGYPDYLLGKTEWISKDQKRTLVLDLFEGAKDADGNPIPILFIAHDRCAELRAIVDTLGQDKWEEYSTRIRVLDTQVMASECGFGRQICLGNLLSRLDIISKNLHNGGMDTFFEAAAAFAMAVRSAERVARSRNDSGFSDGIKADAPPGKLLSTSEIAEIDTGDTVKDIATALSTVDLDEAPNSVTLQQVIDTMIANGASSSLEATHGSFTYCNLCSSTDHVAVECPFKSYQCTNCYSRGHLATVCGIPDSSVSKLRASNTAKFGGLKTCHGCGQLGHTAYVCTIPTTSTTTTTVIEIGTEEACKELRRHLLEVLAMAAAFGSRMLQPSHLLCRTPITG